MRQAESELEAGRASLDQLDRTNRLGMEAAILDLAAAREATKQLPFATPVKSLEVNRKLAAAQFERTEVTAPCNGTILKIYVRQGETIGNKPILQLADLKRMVVVTEVYENEVKYVGLHQKALVTSKAFPHLRPEGVAGRGHTDRPDDQFAQFTERRSLRAGRPARRRGPRRA